MDDSTMRHELEALHPLSFGWALCCCRHDPHRAADALQKAYLKVLAGTARFDGRGSFKTWLFAVIRLTALDEHRRHWLGTLRLLAYGRQQPAPEPEPADEALDRAALQPLFRAALAQLAPRQRELLHLVFYQDLSLAQAAQVMGVSVGTARQHYERGKTGLRRQLKDFPAFQELDHDPPPGPSALPNPVL